MHILSCTCSFHRAGMKMMAGQHKWKFSSPLLSLKPFSAGDDLLVPCSAIGSRQGFLSVTESDIVSGREYVMARKVSINM